MPRNERAQGAEEFGDGAAADGEEEDPKAEEGRACKGRGEGVEQLACRAWQSVLELAELASCLLGLAGLTPPQAAALGLEKSVQLSPGDGSGRRWSGGTALGLGISGQLSPEYTGDGGLLVWWTGSGLPVIPARRFALNQA